MKRRVNKLNEQRILLPIADGLDAAHQRISKGHLASKIGYILKSPKKAYRLFKSSWSPLTAKSLLGSSRRRTTCVLVSVSLCSA